MHAETKDVVNQPADIVYPLVRDEMQKIVPFLPNVDKIETIKYERTSDTRVEVLNHWFAKAEVPSVVKPFLKPEFFQWKDYATWKDDEFCVQYRIESFVANKLFDLGGVNYFTPLGNDKTEIRITFDLEIHPERVPGVPKFLSKRVKEPIEEMVKKMLTPNLTSLVKGLNGYFAKQKG
jgi:hypothetical protein